MIRKTMSLLLSMVLLLSLAVSPAAGEEEDLIIEDVLLDEEGNEVIVDEETGEVFVLSEAEQEILDSLEQEEEPDES